jgi:hypothetical protein
MYWLFKRGFDKDGVETFIDGTFNLKQCTLEEKATFNDDIHLAQVKTKEEEMDIAAASRRKGSIIDTSLGLTEDCIKIHQQQLNATVCNLGKYDFSRPQDLRTVRGNARTGAWTTGESLGKTIYRVAGMETDNADSIDNSLGSDDEEDYDDEVEDKDAVEAVGVCQSPRDDANRQVSFSMELPGGVESDHLSLPVAKCALLRFPGLQLANTEDKDMDGVEPEGADTPSGMFATAVWNMAPENYTSLFGILSQLEKEVIQYRGLPSPVYDAPDGIPDMITDNLRQLLVDGAEDTDLLVFIEGIHDAFEELKSTDEEVRNDLAKLKRSRAQSNLESEDYNPDIAMDPKNDRLSIGGLPSPLIASPQQEHVAGRTVNPQGSLLSTRKMTQVVMGDVETAPAGGVLR